MQNIFVSNLSCTYIWSASTDRLPAWLCLMKNSKKSQQKT